MRNPKEPLGSRIFKVWSVKDLLYTESLKYGRCLTKPKISHKIYQVERELSLADSTPAKLTNLASIMPRFSLSSLKGWLFSFLGCSSPRSLHGVLLHVIVLFKCHLSHVKSILTFALSTYLLVLSHSPYYYLVLLFVCLFTVSHPKEGECHERNDSCIHCIHCIPHA